MTKPVFLAALLAAGTLAFSGCGNKNEDEGGLSGKVTIDGSSTVYPISEALAEAFEQENPGIKVTVSQSGTGGGFKRFSQGETDISNASRPIKPQEHQACVEHKVQYLELPVAYDGLTIVVNKENTWVDQLTVEDLKQIFLSKDSATSWKDVNPDWEDVPLKIFSPGTDSGTFDYFKEIVAGENGSMRSDMSISEDDNFLVTGVATDKGAIGFFGASYYFTNQNKLRAVPIVNPEGQAVPPTPETIESGEYAPFSRPLFIYVNLDSIKRPEMKKFVNFALERAAEMAEKVQYVALPEEIATRAREHVAERLTGTHYLDSEGNKRGGSLTKVYTKENLLSQGSKE